MEIRFECSCDGFTCDDIAKYNFIRLFAPSEDLSLLKDPDEQIIEKKEIFLVYKYPLKNSVKIQHTSENGFERSKLIREISNNYHKFYRETPENINRNGYKTELEYLVLTGLNPIDDNTYEVNVDA